MNRTSAFLCTGVIVIGAMWVLNGTAIAGTDRRAEMTAARDAAFVQADADKSGTLSPAEFTKFHELVRQQMEAARFKHLDTNGDGALSKEELDAGRPMGPGMMGHHRDHKGAAPEGF